MSTSPSVLTLDGVDLRPRPGAPPILRDAHLEARAGEVLVLVGPNGAGKTTALRLLAGLLEPSGGSVLMDGGPYPEDHRRRARAIHLVGADTVPVFDFTVRQVVAMGRYPHRGRAGTLTESDRARVLDALRRADITHLADRSVLRLSSGELRRVWIARALVSEARFLLLDEPTANLDLAHGLQVLELARSLAAEGHGIVLALHDLQGAYDVAHRVALIRCGAIEAVGAPAEVLTPSRIAEVFGVAFRSVPTDDGMPRVRVVAADPPAPREPPAASDLPAQPSGDPP